MPETSRWLSRRKLLFASVAATTGATAGAFSRLPEKPVGVSRLPEKPVGVNGSESIRPFRVDVPESRSR